jgi:uracil-DNA glycosylase
MLTNMTKQQQLDALYAPYKKCKECPLGNLGRINVVFGSGNPDARLMLIGEAPGKEEDIQNNPFVGRSGQLLNRALNAANINREDVFITNIVKCRPPKNRRPTPQESTTCKNLLLLNQIKIIQPRVICTLGSTAIQELLAMPKLQITDIRGNIQKINNITIVPTYHPAYILRNPKKLEILINDLALAQELCDALPSTKNQE